MICGIVGALTFSFFLASVWAICTERWRPDLLRTSEWTEFIGEQSANFSTWYPLMLVIFYSRGSWMVARRQNPARQYCISRNFGSDRHFASFCFRDYPKGVANLHRVDQWVSLPLSPNNHHRHTSSMKSSLEMALRPVSFNLQVRNIHVLHH